MRYSTHPDHVDPLEGLQILSNAAGLCQVSRQRASALLRVLPEGQVLAECVAYLGPLAQLVACHQRLADVL